MQFDELCAAFGALRDRVAELEAEIATLKAREVKMTQVVVSDAARWRVDAVSTKRIGDAAAQAVQAGMVAYRNSLR